MATDVSKALGAERPQTPGPPADSDRPPRANDPSLGNLVAGILDDAQKLIEHQFSLLKLDVHRDLERAKEAGTMLGLGAGLLAAGGLLLLFMLVHLLEWLTRPNLEWWACYGIVGAVVALAGAAVLYRGKQNLEKVNVVPEETAQGLKENLQWKTNPT